MLSSRFHDLLRRDGRGEEPFVCLTSTLLEPASHDGVPCGADECIGKGFPVPREQCVVLVRQLGDAERVCGMGDDRATV